LWIDHKCEQNLGRNAKVLRRFANKRRYPFTSKHNGQITSNGHFEYEEVTFHDSEAYFNHAYEGLSERHQKAWMRVLNYIQSVGQPDKGM
jgi:hypothetical protein